MLVDEVLAIVPGERAVCSKCFPPDDPVFAGHFPGDPLVPGVLLAEGLAQTAGLAAATGLAATAGGPSAGCQRPPRFYLSAIRQMKFLRPVRPGDRLILTATAAGRAGDLWQFDVTATAAGEDAAAIPVATGAVVLASTTPPS